MIVTVTLNAALSVFYQASQVRWDATNQVTSVRHRAGGRGVAVARVLHTFGHEVVAAGLAGGDAGEMIRADLAQGGIPTAFTRIGHESRRVTEVRDGASGRRLRLSEPGPYITTEELGRFAADFRRLLSDATAVVLCGSLPAGMPPEIYGSLATYAAEAGVPAILDAGGPALRYGAVRRPALVIPDIDAAAPHATAGDAAEGTPADGGLAAAVPADGGMAGAVPADGAMADAVPADGGLAPGAAAHRGRAGAMPADRAALVAAHRAAGYGAAQSAGGIDPQALVAAGAGAVALVSGHVVHVITEQGRWNARIPGAAGPPWPRDALVAGLVPGVLLGWSWPDRLRHAVALGASVGDSGEVDLVVYERLMAEVVVQPPGDEPAGDGGAAG